MYENLKKLIKEKGYTVNEFCEHLYLNRSNYYYRMIGKTAWTKFEIETIKKELGYDLAKRKD